MKSPTSGEIKKMARKITKKTPVDLLYPFDHLNRRQIQTLQPKTLKSQFDADLIAYDIKRKSHTPRL